MKYFIIEGTLINPDLVTDEIMEKHKAYTQKAMDKGLILMSGLKLDFSGSVFLMKSEYLNIVEEYLNNEPFKLNKIQEYKLIEFKAHYCNDSPSEWFNK